MLKDVKKTEAREEKIFVTARELSKLVSKCEQSLANDRYEGVGFPYSKIGKKILYHWPTIEKLLLDNMVFPNRWRGQSD